MGQVLIERRKEPRCPATAMRVRQATMRPGRHVQVIDLSPSGALVQTDSPLRPGHRIHIRLVFDTFALSLAALIVRCAVSAIHHEDGVIYRGGLRFDERCLRLAEASARTPGPGVA